MSIKFVIFVIIFVAVMAWAASTMGRLRKKDTYDSRDWLDFWYLGSGRDNIDSDCDNVGDSDDNDR